MNIGEKARIGAIPNTKVLLAKWCQMDLANRLALSLKILKLSDRVFLAKRHFSQMTHIGDRRLHSLPLADLSDCETPPFLVKRIHSVMRGNTRFPHEPVHQPETRDFSRARQPETPISIPNTPDLPWDPFYVLELSSNSARDPPALDPALHLNSKSTRPGARRQ